MSTSKFDQFAEAYESTLDRSINISGESSEYFANYKAAYIVRQWPDLRGKVLDFGCGVGLLSRLLKKKLPDAEIHGYDPSLRSIQSVPVELLSQGVFTSNLEETETSYDLIVIANVMHHIAPADRQDVVLALRKKLSPSGRITVFEHNPWNPLTRWVVAHCEFDDDAILLRPVEIRSYLTNVGLAVRKDYIVFFPRRLFFLRHCEPFLQWCPVGAQYVSVGEVRSGRETAIS